MFQTTAKRRLFVFGAVTFILSLMALLNNLLTLEIENWIAIFALGVSCLLFTWAYIFDREVYAAIGAYVTLAIIGLILMTNWLLVEGALVPSYVLAAVALPFLLAWLFKRQNWAMLIPAYVLFAIIPVFYMGENVTAELVPAYVLTVIGLPFFIAYVLTQKWVWLLPSGILFVIAASFVGVAFGMPLTFMSIGLPVITLIGGLVLLLRAMSQSPDEKQKL
jgi:hypothetical protein